MSFKSLSLTNFKNHADRQLDFCEGINAFTGANGAGKTNVLDAIHYLCLTKSYLGNNDRQHIAHEHDFFVLQAEVQLQDVVSKIHCGVSTEGKKSFKLNGKEYNRLSEHIGKLPVIIVSPYDTNLVHEGREERRKLIDNVLSQIDVAYLQHIMVYNRLLQQRNALLKTMAESGGGSQNTELCELYAEQMLLPAKYIINQRQNFTQKISDKTAEIYAQLCQTNEVASIDYEADSSEEALNTAWHGAISRDLAAQRTTLGPHRDDFHFFINGFTVKKYASQGQQKSFLVALKLALFNIIHQEKQNNPILLLDDIFDKLDENRTHNLLEMVARAPYGQIFITDTHHDRVKKLLKTVKVQSKLFEIS